MVEGGLPGGREGEEVVGRGDGWRVSGDWRDGEERGSVVAEAKREFGMGALQWAEVREGVGGEGESDSVRSGSA